MVVTDIGIIIDSNLRHRLIEPFLIVVTVFGMINDVSSPQA